MGGQLQIISSQPLPEATPPQPTSGVTPPAPGQPIVNDPTAAFQRGGAISEAGEGIAKGALSTAGGLTDLVARAIQKLPGGGVLVPEEGRRAGENLLQENTQLTTPGQKAGGLIEEGAEWMGGDAVLKSLGKLGAIARNAPELLELVEKYPTAARLLLGASRGAAVGGAQAGAKAPSRGESASKAAEAGAAGGAVGGAVGEAVPAALESKLARSWVNRSLGAGARDVTYGNPAKALLDEGIKNPLTGDIELYKDALRAGKSPQLAAQAAGGRIASINEKINEVKPELDGLLKKSTVRIPVNDVVDRPIAEATVEIDNNRAMTRAEKDQAISKLEQLKESLKEGLGKTIRPAEANDIKQQIGERVNWGGTTAVTDEVKPVYRALYGGFKQAVHDAVPEASQLDERLTNLMAAWHDVVPLARKEEVGAGTGVTAGFVWDVLRRFEAELGRVIPAIKAGAEAPATKAALGVAGEETGRTTFRASDGSVHSVPSDQLGAARQIDPDLQIIPNQP